jgi:co-chaperonin GroES (HSP10)
MLAFKTKDGKWLVVRESHTHTGHHVNISYTDDINEASTGIILPMRLRHKIASGELVAVGVEVTRTVTETTTQKETR